jgi:hypothetical protein
MTNFSDFKLLTKADAAVIFGVCTKTVDNYIREGRLPEPVQFASREYWHPEDFQAFLDRTFRRSAPAHPDQTAAGASPPPRSEAMAIVGGVSAPRGAERDSNPAVRQQARQRAKLRALNTGA